MKTNVVSTTDIARAKRAIDWSDDADDSLIEKLPDLDGELVLDGDVDDLRKIRAAMKEYERREANVGEDKMMYDSRYTLQFMEVAEEKDR